MIREQPLIAIIDDDAPFLDMMSDVFADERYQTICCQQSDLAQTLIRKELPDVVILDMRLGRGVSGWTVLEAIRLAPSTKYIPVIVCSADAHFLRNQEDKLKAYACEIVEKPFDLDTLLAVVRRCLATSPIALVWETQDLHVMAQG